MEVVKKPYKPKADKVEKLSKVYAELKKAMPKNNLLFKGVVKCFFVVVLFGSCSAEYHLKKAIQKNPKIITEKVIRKVDTLIIRDSIKIENTYVTKYIDTIVIDNERFNTTIYRYHDTLRLLQVIKGDTIRIETKTVVPVITEVKWWEKYLSFFAAGLSLILAIIWVFKNL
jgi:hypothetical protein